MASEAQILSREMILSAYKAALHLSRVLYKSATYYAKQSQFPKSQMNVSIFSQKDYENKSNWTIGESKPNSNPIKANLQKAKMNISYVKTTNYEQKTMNYANNKQTQFPKSPK